MPVDRPFAERPVPDEADQDNTGEVGAVDFGGDWEVEVGRVDFSFGGTGSPNDAGLITEIAKEAARLANEQSPDGEDEGTEEAPEETD